MRASSPAVIRKGTLTAALSGDPSGLGRRQSDPLTGTEAGTGSTAAKGTGCTKVANRPCEDRA